MKNIGKIDAQTLIIVFLAGMLWKITIPLAVIGIVGLLLLDKIKKPK